MVEITEPGVYDLTDDDYHADPCPLPSLSSSISKELLEKSPRHAWIKHPRLNENFKSENKPQFDLGKASHAMLLEGERRFVVVDAKNYTTKDAREARDQAYEDGKIPLLPAQVQDVENMAKAARLQLNAHEDAFAAFTNGKPEQTLVWKEGEVWCRCKLDWKPNGGNLFYDFKSTSVSANPEIWGQRTMFDTGCDVQAAFYRRGIKAVLGIEDAHFHFVVQETKAPYALSVVAVAPATLGMANRKVEEAIRWWAWCQERGYWPGYPKRTSYVEAPPWVENRWLEREEREDMITESGEDLREVMMNWQAPLEAPDDEGAAK